MTALLSRQNPALPGFPHAFEPGRAIPFRGRIRTGRVTSGNKSFLLPEHKASQDAPANRDFQPAAE
jgi:hypothetical protein